MRDISELRELLPLVRAYDAAVHEYQEALSAYAKMDFSVNKEEHDKIDQASWSLAFAADELEEELRKVLSS